MLSSSGEKEPAGSSGENLASRVAEKKAVPAVNRGGSGIMQSFAKAAGKPAKAKSTPDPPMKAMSDDGEDELDAVPQPKKLSDGDATRRTRKDREAELRRMMEEDDDETDVKAEDSQSGAMTPDNGMMEEASTATSETEKETKPAVEILPNAGDGRRRGKRKVMKKKQVMDEEGFLGELEPG
jgi:DNA polymerase delta subunit 3